MNPKTAEVIFRLAWLESQYRVQHRHRWLPAHLCEDTHQDLLRCFNEGCAEFLTLIERQGERHDFQSIFDTLGRELSEREVSLSSSRLRNHIEQWWGSHKFTYIAGLGQYAYEYSLFMNLQTLVDEGNAAFAEQVRRHFPRLSLQLSSARSVLNANFKSLSLPAKVLNETFRACAKDPHPYALRPQLLAVMVAYGPSLCREGGYRWHSRDSGGAAFLKRSVAAQQQA